jgi:hypothetical protein
LLPTGEKIKKRSRTPVTHQLRCSSRVSAPRVHADVEIDLTVPPPRKTKKGPSLRQLELADKIFSDDVDKNLQYYVCEVKYYEQYDQVCCLCVPYHGDVVKAKMSSVIYHNANDIDKYVFDCNFVRNNIV